MKILITGGGGFIGSHAAEFYATQGAEVIVFDNLSRSNLLRKSQNNRDYNRIYLQKYPNVMWVRESVLNREMLETYLCGVDLVIHAAAQTAVTASYQDPRSDFLINAEGAFNLLEAVRQQSKPPAVICCSTNKVYGDRINRIPVVEQPTRYEFKEKSFKNGINEDFGVDLCGHAPYGCSKLAADLYMQDYALHYGFKIGIFRQSCVYGPRQFGFEDQGWLAWFALANHFNKPITLYGDGKQVRDVLFISDLVAAFDAFVRGKVSHQVFNIGGGPKHTLSLLECLDLLERITGRRGPIRYADRRPADQKVYISDIRKAEHSLRWCPKISVEAGVTELVKWVQANENLFKDGTYWN